MIVITPIFRKNVFASTLNPDLFQNSFSMVNAHGTFDEIKDVSFCVLCDRFAPQFVRLTRLSNKIRFHECVGILT